MINLITLRAENMFGSCSQTSRPLDSDNRRGLIAINKEGEYLGVIQGPETLDFITLQWGRVAGITMTRPEVEALVRALAGWLAGPEAQK